MTTVGIATQAVGFLGYGLLLASTFARRRTGLLLIDAGGGFVLVIHWGMLGAIAGVTMNGLYTLLDLAGLDPGARRGRVALIAAIPMSIALVAIFWQGPTDLLALAGVLMAIASRASHGQIRLRALALVGSIPWGVFGLLEGSAPQVTFSIVYAIAMGVSIWRIRSGRWSRPTTPDDVAILPADGAG